jgi:transposase-like protein
MDVAISIETIRHKFQVLAPLMNERMRRLWAGSESLALGRGGISVVATATGLSRNTITAGRRELRQDIGESTEGASTEHSRHPGGGRKRLTTQDPTLLKDLYQSAI